MKPLRKDNYSNRVPKKLGEWIIFRINTDQRLTKPERITHAVDHNCHPARALAAWFARPRWRQFDPSIARNCCHRPDY
jgi:hypothetical protein